MSSVTSARPWAIVSARYLAAWGISNSGDRVVIGLTDITPSLRRAAAAAFGNRAELTVMQRPYGDVYRYKARSVPRLIKVRNSAAVRSDTCSRLMDCTPRIGGDRIVRHAGSTVYECTASWSWANKPYKGGSDAVTTAGHCSSTGTTWLQGYYDPAKNTIYYTGSAGKDVLTSWGNNRADGEVLKGVDWNPEIYYTNSRYGLTIGYNQPMENEVVCADGSFTGKSCNGLVQNPDECAKISDGGTTVRVCDLAYATSDHRLSQPGDSGGPVWAQNTISPPQFPACGLISAGNNSGTELYFSDMSGLEHALHGVPTIAP
ncbi:MAG: hypothetical protein ACREFO_00325 [Acetobacteraceae bacterium]